MKILRYLGFFIGFIFLLFLTYDGQKPYSEIEIKLSKLYNEPMNFSNDKYPTSLENISKLNFDSYKWLLNFYRFFSYIFCTFLILLSLFPFKKVFLTLIYAYILILFTSIILICLGFLFHNFTLGFGNIQYLKRFIQSPVLLIFLGMYFWKINPIYSSNS